MKLSKSVISRWLARESFPLNLDNTKVMNGKLFLHLLCLERKRSQRTGDPFVLMILDLSKLGEKELLRIPDVCIALRSETRDTDLCGWYRFPDILGMIFTALENADRKSAEDSISAKVKNALNSVFSPDEMARVRVAFYHFPEEPDRNKTSGAPSKVFHPDLVKLGPAKTTGRGVKRGIDVAGSLFLILLLSPFLALVAVMIRASSRGPALFRQSRVGRYGIQFSCLKFRTMYTDCDHGIHKEYIQNFIQQGDEQRKVYKIVNDPRVTPVGKFLRKSSLDELPQLFNVLRGDMSLVGPRPPIPYEISFYRPWHWRRIHESKPGLTGMWQVFGRSRTNFDEMVRLDIRYIEDQSLWLDLKLLLLTPRAVITGSGAY